MNKGGIYLELKNRFKLVFYVVILLLSLGNIVLKGQSPTILLDGAPHTQSFGGMQTVNTGIIANSVFNQALNPNLYDFKVNPRNTSYINYSSQYNETHYNYIFIPSFIRTFIF